MTTLREIEDADFEAMADALIEMQAYYHVPCPPRDAIIAGLNSRPAGSRILLAYEHDKLAGFACFSALYPGPGLTSGFFLKELYVRENWRGSGLGKELMSRLAVIARQDGHGRIDWTVDADDLRLQRFYEMLGGQALPAKLFFRITGAELTALADKGLTALARQAG